MITLRTTRTILVALLGCMLLSGCFSIINTPPPPKRIMLAPDMPKSMNLAKPLNIQVMVSQPEAWTAIDTDAIALLLSDREIRYLSGVRFMGTTPSLAQSFIVEALTRTEAFQGVSTDTSGINARVRLFGDVRLFALEYQQPGQPPAATMEATFRLLDRRDGRIIGTYPIHITKQATGTSVDAMMKAHEELLTQTLADLSTWTVQTLLEWSKTHGDSN